jgi:outer membrane protein
MKNLFLGIVLVIAFSIVSAQGQKLTLQQCVEMGIANNLDVLQSDLQAQADEVNWKQAKLNLMPDLNATASHGIRTGRSIDPFTNTYLNQNSNYSSYGLFSNVTLFNGMVLQHLIRQNKLTYEASKMTLQQRKDNLTLNIILAYLQVERLEVLNKEGAIQPSMYTDVKGQYAGDQLGILNAQNNLETAKITLCQFMNVPYTRDFSVERLDASAFMDQYADTPDKVYETALQQFAQVKAADYTLQSSATAVKVQRGRLFPRLSFNAGFGTNYSNTATTSTLINTTDVVSSDYVIVNGNPTNVIRKQGNFSSQKISYTDQLKNNRNSGFSLDMQIPIFNNLFQRNQVKLAKLTMKSNDLAFRTVKTQLQQSIEQAYVNMTTAADRYKILLEQVEAYKESFRAAEIRFNAGVGNSIDYLTAKNNLDRANINLINAQYDYVLRTKVLDYYKGMKLW